MAVKFFNRSEIPLVPRELSVNRLLQAQDNVKGSVKIRNFFNSFAQLHALQCPLKNSKFVILCCELFKLNDRVVRKYHLFCYVE